MGKRSCVRKRHINLLNVRKTVWLNTYRTCGCGAAGPTLACVGQQMDDDQASVRTPTQSELHTFQVLANQEFTNFGKKAPTAAILQGGLQLQTLREDSQDRERGHAADDRERDRDAQRREPSPAVSHAGSRVSVRDVFGGGAGGGLWGGAEGPLRSTPLATPERGAERHAAEDHGGGERAEIRRSESRELERATAPQMNWNEPERAISMDRATVPVGGGAAGGTSSAEWAAAKKEAEIDVAIEKEALLYELELMEKQGNLQLHRRLTMADSLESIQYQYDRANMIINTQQTVDWAKGGIKFGSMMLEAGLKRFGIGIVDGFSKNLTQDMTKFNRPLTKMYRKYWRRGTSSPEMELAMIVFGALAMTVVGNSNLLGGLFGGGSKAQQPNGGAPGAAFGGLAAGGAAAPAPTVPGISALRPPTVNAFGGAPAGPPAGPPAPQQSGAGPVVPDWAKAAIAAGPPPVPQHFARVVPPQPEAPEPFPVRNAPLPVMPVPARLLEMRPPEMRQSETMREPEAHQYVARDESEDHRPPVSMVPAMVPVPTQPPPTVRRLTLNSPTKSSRRRREPVQELNLDDE